MFVIAGEGASKGDCGPIGEKKTRPDEIPDGPMSMDPTESDGWAAVYMRFPV